MVPRSHYSQALLSMDSFWEAKKQIPQELFNLKFGNSSNIGRSLNRIKEFETEIRNKIESISNDRSFSSTSLKYRRQLADDLLFYSSALLEVVDQSMDYGKVYQSLESENLKQFYKEFILSGEKSKFSKNSVHLNKLYSDPAYESEVLSIFENYKLNNIEQLSDYIRLVQTKFFHLPNKISIESDKKLALLSNELKSKFDQAAYLEFNKKIITLIREHQFLRKNRNKNLKILILAHGSGGGHLTLGNAISCFLDASEFNYETKFVDVYKEIKGGTIQNLTNNSLSQLDFYNEAFVRDNVYLKQNQKKIVDTSYGISKQNSSEKLKILINDFAPDLVILTSNKLYDYQNLILRSKIPLWVYLADFVPVFFLKKEKEILKEHAITQPNFEPLFKLFGPIEISNAVLKNDANQELKLPYILTELPLRPNFEAPVKENEFDTFRQKYKLDSSKKLASFAMGAWGNKVSIDYLKALLQKIRGDKKFLNQWQFFFLTGSKLYKEMSNLVEMDYRDRIKIVESLETREMKILLKSTEFYISKTGGITTEEVINTNSYLGFVPALLTYSHERYNFEYLFNYKKAILVLGPDDLFHILQNLPKLESTGALNRRVISGRKNWRITLKNELKKQFPDYH